jgi:hypothetical protein
MELGLIPSRVENWARNRSFNQWHTKFEVLLHKLSDYWSCLSFDYDVFSKFKHFRASWKKKKKNYQQSQLYHV